MSREELEKRALEARYNLVSSKDKETIDILEELAIKALCDKCVYSTKDGYCQYDDITETIPPFEPSGDLISRRKAIIVISGCDGKSAQIEALEQLPSVRPQEPILDKIRAEIEQEYNKYRNMSEKWDERACGIGIAVEIIDKYIKEQE